MPQISLYIDDETLRKVELAAKKGQMSMGRRANTIKDRGCLSRRL